MEKDIISEIENRKYNVDTLQIYKLFINRDYFNLINLYINSSIYNKLKWKYIIRYILETTHDFEMAYIVKHDHKKLYDFFQRYTKLSKIKLEKNKIGKEEKEQIKQSWFYKEFEDLFNDRTSKLILMRLICYIVRPLNFEYIPVSHDSMESVFLLNYRLEQLEIPHLDLSTSKNNKNIKIDKSYVKDFIINENENMNENENNKNINKSVDATSARNKTQTNLTNLKHLSNDKCENDNENKNIKNISTEILIFLFVNNIVDIRNLAVFLNSNEVIIKIPYYKSTLNFNNLIIINKMLNELKNRKKIEIRNILTKYEMINNLSAREKIGIKNIYEILNLE